LTAEPVVTGDETSATSAAGSVVLTHDVGLHARPSVKLTKLAKTFQSRIDLATADGGPWIDAKSIVKVMAARAPKDTVLHFRAEGSDARHAVDALVALVRSDFGETPDPGNGVDAGAA
jgi:phosphocarrier protein HPr